MQVCNPSMKSSEMTCQSLSKLVENNKTNSCWRFLAAIDQDGYGRIRIDGKVERAHVVFYQAFVGAVPPNGRLRHQRTEQGCVGPACCNSAHLKYRQNVIEAGVRKQFCIHGHGLTPENTEAKRWREGKVRLRNNICRNEERRKRHAAKLLRLGALQANQFEPQGKK